MFGVIMDDGKFLALISWNCKAWIVVWEEKDEKIVPRIKAPFYDYLSDLDEVDLEKLNGLPLNVSYDEKFKVAFSLY
jgi:hypothetical protein